MLVIISPAKKLDFDSPCPVEDLTKPAFLSKTNNLSLELKKLKAQDVGKLMKLSPQLAELNYNRFQSFKPTYNPSTSKQAAYAFNGDTYTGLNILALKANEIQFAQKKLRILSGLYGVLKPLDLIQPYRLEMGTKLNFQKFKSLYEYWSQDVTNYLNQELADDPILINCASQEYFSVIDKKQIKAQIITPSFKEYKNGDYKMIGLFAKRARGMMARFIIQNKINNLAGLKDFKQDGYQYNKKLSTLENPVFTR